MKKGKLHGSFLLWLALMISGSVVAQKEGFSALRTNFAQPGRHYGSAPLWVWNTKITRGNIDSMLIGFKKNAFGGVFVHPRPGLITEYLSKEWNDDYAYTVKKARELGLDVWIYDENSYPSGFAGGHVPNEMPSSYNQGQMLHLTKVSELPAVMDKYIYCIREEDGKLTDVSGEVSSYAGKKGSYYLFSKEFYHRSPWFGGFSYVDLMVKGVTEKFIDVTMKGYEQRFGEEFGRTVRGIFSDEAQIEAQGSGNIRWTPDLFPSFREKWGYDLQAALVSLFEEKGDWRKVRHDYFSVLLDLFVDRWSKPFAAYAASKGLEWTGHYWEHEWPNPNQGPDNMAMYMYPQRPGIDMLFNQFNETSPGAQFGNVRSVKELSSVSNQMGQPRTLSETYGGGGWDLTFKDMKRLGDWEFVLGVNTLNQHLAHMTIAGARKYDYPQSFSYHTPWWPYYASLNEHFTRLTYAVTRGEERNQILVLEPTSTAWMYYNHDKPNSRMREIGEGFQQFVTQLSKTQVEYDLGSEYIIRDKGSVVNGKFVVGRRAYGIVVIPRGMENIDGRTLELLKTFAAQGGKIVQLEKLTMVDGKQMDVPELAGKTRDLEEALAAADLAMKVTGGNVFHQRRQLTDGQVLLLVNSDMSETSKMAVRMEGKKVLLMNTFSGKIETYPSRIENGRVAFTCELPPAGSLLLYIAKGDPGVFPAMIQRKANEQSIPGSETAVVRPAENTLMIDFCDVSIGGTVLKDKHVYYAADTVFRHYGFSDGNPWNTSVQFKRNIVDRDTFSRGSGFSVSYHFTVSEGVDAGRMKAVVERAGSYVISINGEKVEAQAGKWWLDKSFGVLNIGRHVHAGENTLTLTTDRMSIYDEIEPIYLLGNFSLQSMEKGWALTAPGSLKLGSWKDQGMPMYGQGVTYKKALELKTKPDHLAVRLRKWKGTMAVVKVNGRQAGVIAYDPYELDIAPFIVKGKNDIEVSVMGSLRNLLGPHHKRPRPGLASPWHWKGITEFPAGKEYDVYDYGMMEDMEFIAW